MTATKMLTPHQRGMAMITVLLVLSILLMLGTIFLRSTSREIGLADAQAQSIQARQLADGGVRLAMLGMLIDDEEDVWWPNGEVHRIDFGEDAVFVRLSSSASLIDINRADWNVLKSLLMFAGAAEEDAEEVASEIIAWRQSAKPQRVEHFVSDEDYRDAGLPTPRRSDFIDVKELANVMGMQASWFWRIRPLLTVHGNDRVDALTASRDVLLALPDIKVDAVDEFLAERAEKIANRDWPSVDKLESPYVSIGVRAEIRLQSLAVLASGGSYGLDVVLRTGKSDNNEPFNVIQWQVMPSEIFAEMRQQIGSIAQDNDLRQEK